MAFPLYVAIAPDGIVRYASNDFGKMQLFLADALAPDTSRTLFVPMAPADRWKTGSPLPVDFGSTALQSLLARPDVKLPGDLPEGTRLGRLPNDTIVIVRPASARTGYWSGSTPIAIST